MRYIQAIKQNIEKANRATYSILRRAKQLQMSVSCQVHIINTVVKPILLYGSEIFCFEKLNGLDSCYVQILKKILQVKKSTPSFMIYGE